MNEKEYIKYIKELEERVSETEKLSHSGNFNVNIKTEMFTLSKNFCYIVGIDEDTKTLLYSDFTNSCDSCFVIRGGRRFNSKMAKVSEVFGINEMDIENLKNEYFLYCDFTLNSRRIYVRVYYRPIVEENEIIAVECIATDVTRLKEKEEELQLSKEILEKTEAVSKAGSWILDMKTKIYTFSANFCKLASIGDEKIEIPLDHYSKLTESSGSVMIINDEKLPYRSLFDVIEAFGGNINDISTLKNEYNVVVLMGNGSYVDCLYAPIIADGELISIVGLSRDITESKKYEENLLKEKKRLEKTEEVSKAGNFSFDFRTDMFTFSSNFCKVVGMEAKETIISYQDYCQMTEGSYITKENGEVKLYSDYKNAKENLLGDLVKDHYYVQVQINNDIGFIDSTYYTVYEDGQLVGVAGLIRDVTSEKTREKELIVAKEKAEEATAQQSRFVANMSHEIRTPLNAILGYAEIMKEQNKDGKLNHYLKSIDMAGNSLLSLINDILDFSKVKANKFKANYIPAILGDFLEECKVLFFHKLNQKNLDFEIFYDLDLPTFLLPTATIRQILINVMGNAIKFTNKGGVYISAKAVENQDATYNIDIEVKDTGIGIPKDKQELIFREFEQADTSHEKVGTGLGLALSVNFARLIGGEIDLVSEEGKGSSFTLRLKNVELASHKVQILHREKEDVKVKFFGQRVLVLDDIKNNRDVLSAHCEFLGLEPKAFEHGADALLNLESFNPDIILTDLRMPDMNGEEFANNVKAIEKFKETPIICITASINPEENYHLQNFDDVLNKPIGSMKLSKTLSKYLVFEQILEDSGENEKFNLHTAFRKLSMSDEELKEFIDEHGEDLKRLKVAIKPKTVSEGSDLLIDMGKKTNNDVLVSIGENLRLYCDSFDIVNMKETINQMILFLEKKDE